MLEPSGSVGASPQGFAGRFLPKSVNPVLFAAVFSVKTFVAALLALFISFWLGLDDPYWALLTVFLLAQPDSGLVLAKAFYRLVGTAAGVLMTTALVFAFAQYGELFIASLAIWIGVCSFAARGTRNFAAYGFQLAGYTVAIVGLPAALDPAGAHDLLVARCTEISIGVGCVALVSRLIFPRDLSPKLLALTRQLLHRVDRFAEIAADRTADQEQLASARTALAEGFSAVEAMRSSAFFESADARLMNPTLREAVQAAVDLYAVSAEMIASAGPSSDHSLAAADRVSPVTPKMVFALRSDAAARALSHARGRLAECLAALDKGETLSTPSPGAPLWSDPATAVLTGIRAALAVIITSVFWLLTTWPSGPASVVIAGMLCMRFAAMPQPGKTTATSLIAVLVTAVPVFVTQIYLLPYASDFLSMALLLAPLLLTSAFIIAHPRIGPIGLLSGVYLAFTSDIDNNSIQSYDPLGFFNTTLALLLGIGVSLVLFETFFPETPQWSARRFLRQVRVHLSRLAIAPRPNVSAFDFALCEQLASTLTRVKGEPVLARDCLLAGTIGLTTGRAIGRLRSGITTNQQSAGVSAEVSRLLAGLSRVYYRPSWARITKNAWDARVASRRLLAKARAEANPASPEMLFDLAMGCEALRSDLLKMRTLVRES